MRTTSGRGRLKLGMVAGNVPRSRIAGSKATSTSGYLLSMVDTLVAVKLCQQGVALDFRAGGSPTARHAAR